MNSNRALIERFKAYFGELQHSDPSQLGALYDQNIVYKAPSQRIRGLVELEDHHASLIEDVRYCRYEFLDELLGDDAAYLKWVMHCSHPRSGERTHSLRGVSHLKYTDRIHYQEDFYDVDATDRAHSPIVGNVRRWFRLRLVS